MEQQYESVAELGAGVYGAATTLKARDLREQGRFVALLKGLRLQTGGGPEEDAWQLLQLQLLTKLEHPNVVRLLDVFVDIRDEGGARHAVVCELVDQDLSTYLGKSPHTPSHHIKEVTRQLLCGLRYLHGHGLEHRELTPRSVLVTASGRVKIAGWGLARFLDSASRAPTPAVSPSWYRAPELLLLRVTCGPAAADLWSVGCIFAEMFTRRPLFPGGSDVDQLTEIFRLLGVPSLEEWPLGASLPHGAFAGLPAAPRALADSVPEVGPEVGPDNENLAMALMLDLLTFSPRKRISAFVALYHPYFSEATDVATGESTATSEGAATGEDEA
ncbi:cyclin-dependent kinase 4-like [Lethenteron reissneri]|uniref:cyclin-dependent kinase 4-like n=1 Tax=Lethenteron reissneri TaxID=7753 RepID=UPI002AB7B819|nr:cyclin-dependent kinase 4-like [Lethenteron reissneri]XP_061437014.1 cyclin-dependent kinase 4-like [Lethenteron reissneri]